MYPIYSFLYLFVFCSAPFVYSLEIPGRDGHPLYRVKLPKQWAAVVTEDVNSLLDTTYPLAEFSITEGEEKITITVHNFPHDQLSERIPPQAQVARWKRQFERLDPSSLQVVPQAFGGYAGLCLEVAGEISGKSVKMIGFAMGLGADHFRMAKSSQIKADWTIKAVGPQQLIERYREEILVVAHTFELIEPIPSAR